MRQLIYNVDQNNIDFFESFRQACSEKNIRLTQKFPQYKDFLLIFCANES